MEIHYPKHSQLKELTSVDFELLAELYKEPIFAALKGMGFQYPWLTCNGAVEKVILQGVEVCLDQLKENPLLLSAETVCGKVQVEIDIYDEDGDGIDEVVPALFIEICNGT